MPDGKPATMVISAGFDVDTKKFVATWFGSMMTKLWVYECSREGNILNMDAEGPSMSGDGTTAMYRDSIEIVDADNRIFRSQMRNPDGSWMQFMTMEIPPGEVAASLARGQFIFLTRCRRGAGGWRAPCPRCNSSREQRRDDHDLPLDPYNQGAGGSIDLA